jgi:AraC-like DNA-binding protein
MKITEGLYHANDRNLMSFSEELDYLGKRFVIGYVIVVLLTLAGYLYLAWDALNLFPFNLFVGGLIALLITILVLCCTISFAEIRTLLSMFIALAIIVALPLILLAHVTGGPSAYFLLVVTPLGIHVLYPNLTSYWRSVICWSSVLLILVLLIGAELLTNLTKRLLINLLPIEGTAGVKTEISFLLPIVSATVLMYHCMLYFMKMNEVRIAMKTAENIAEMTSDTVVSSEKFDELYAKIIEFMEKEKPYLHSDFSIAQLSMQLGTNATYISKAIKANNPAMNFNLLVNNYRIQRVKEMAADHKGRYTLEFMYLSAGFTNQSTFNKVFRQIEGITPTEFLKTCDEAKEN